MQSALTLGCSSSEEHEKSNDERRCDEKTEHTDDDHQLVSLISRKN